MANNSTIGTAYVQIEPSTRGIEGKLANALGAEAESAGKSAGGKFASIFGSAAKVGLAAVGATSSAVAGFGATAVNAGKAFDASMSQVAATMGKTTGEISDLRDFAQQMGSSTAFSATEAAEALNYMALAGYDADMSMKMLPTVLDLAAAGGINLARASDMVTDAQSALGLGTKETETLVNQMAAAASRSNTSVEQLGDAILTIGANAKGLSGGTTELSTALGLLADNGIKGAEGGTHLRNILLSLNPTTDAAVAAWEKLGVSAYDANGNLRPLEDTFSEIESGLKGMSDQEKTDILSSMFNKTDLAAVNALLGTSKTRWDELTNAIDTSKGAAEKMASTQLDNLAGDVTLFKSALEGAQIAVSDSLTPTLREFVQFGSDGLSDLTEAFKTGGIDAAVDTLGDLLSTGLTKLVDMLPSLIDTAVTLLSALGRGLIDNMPVLIESIMQILETLIDTLLEGAPEFLSAALELILNLGEGLVTALPELIPNVIDVILGMVDVFLDNLDKFITLGLDAIVALAEGLIDALPKLMDRVPIIIERLVEAIVANLPKLIACALQLIIALANGLIQAIPRLLAAIPEIIAAIVSGLISGISDIMKVGGDLVDGLWQGIKNSWSKLVDGVKNLASGIVDTFKDIFKIGSPSKILRDEVGRWLPEGVAVGIEATADSPVKALSAMADDMTSTIQSQLSSDIMYSGALNYGELAENTPDNGISEMLAQYLPMLANIGATNITLEGDAKNMFNVVRKQNNIYKRATGASAFA